MSRKLRAPLPQEGAFAHIRRTGKSRVVRHRRFRGPAASEERAYLLRGSLPAADWGVGRPRVTTSVASVDRKLGPGFPDP